MEKFDDIFIDDTRNVERVSSKEYLKKGKIAIVDQGKEKIIGYTNCKTYKVCKEERIIFGDHTRIFKYINVPFITGADGTKVLKIRDVSKYSYKYLYYYLLHSYIPDTGYNRHFKWIKELNFDVPIIDEQIKIANKLDKIQILIDIRKKQIEELDKLIKSQFVEMFGNKNFEKKEIRELVDRNIIKAKKKFSNGEKIKYIDISSIDNAKNQVIGFNEFEMGKEPSRAQQCLEKNDILISTVRPNLKNVAVNRYDDNNIVGTSGFCVLRSINCLQEYLLYIVLSEEFTRDMISKTTGANYPAISNNDVLDYKIELPPIELQNQFAEFVKLIDKQKFEIQKSLEEMEKLQESLMNKYLG